MTGILVEKTPELQGLAHKLGRQPPRGFDLSSECAPSAHKGCFSGSGDLTPGADHEKPRK